MAFSFIYPAALWLLLLLPLIWLLTLRAQAAASRPIPTASTPPQRERSDRSLAVLARSRFGLLRLALRSIIFVLLVLALAGTQLVRGVDDLTVVFMIDGSDSVSPAQRQQAIDYINTALEARDENDQAAVVVFGENALVEWAPAELASLSRLTSTPIANRTNIAEAIQLGLALFPADSQKRLVLLSDGYANLGQTREAAQLAATRGVPLDVVPLPGTSGPDVLVSALDAPDTAREGQDVTLQVHIRSSIDTTGELQVFADGELVDTQQLDIQSGTSTLPVTIPGGEPGFHRYEVRLEAEGDAEPINNRAAAFTTVEGPPRVLLIASDPEHAAPLQTSLEAASARVELVAPESAPAEQDQLRTYAAVILVDVLAREVPRAVQQALPVYVQEQGGSLAMIGGRESFGAGGWRRTPIAEALPVRLEPQDREQRPDVGLVLVIDRSGSMSNLAGTGLTKLDLAKEAVYQSSLGLERGDQIGVVGFDMVSNWVLPVQPLPNLADIEQALSAFNADGGTNIRSGIEPAAEALATLDARTRHVILLTDGLADSNYADLIREMQNNGVTISVVSIGEDANPALREIAELGGGRFYRVQTLSEVPNVFLSETVIVAGRDIVEGQFTPQVTLPVPAVRGLGSLPPLYGYNSTEQRQTARTMLVSPDNKPILAQWQYGLGRSVAWTSDMKGQWARDWTTWGEFPRFVSGLLDMLLPPQQASGLTLEASTTESQTMLDLTVRDTEGRPLPLSDAEIEARILDPDDEGSPLSFRQIGVGRYRALVDTSEPGVYLAQVSVLDSEGELVGTINRGIAISYSPEYRQDRTASAPGGLTPLLADLATVTEGTTDPAPPAVFRPTGQAVGIVQDVSLPLLWLALLLWPLDIGVRRLLLRRSDVAALLEPVATFLGRLRPRRPATAPAESTVARLQTARERVRRPARPARTSEAPPTPPAEQPQPAQRPQPTSQPQRSTSTSPASKPANPPRPPAERKPARPPARPPERSPAARSDDAIASLLAAKQRARRRGQQPPPEDTKDES